MDETRDKRAGLRGGVLTDLICAIEGETIF
jgi:hypothetical protein